MARPIKETPTLSGKDAEKFVKAMYEVKPVTEAYKREMKAGYERLKKTATFTL